MNLSNFIIIDSGATRLQWVYANSETILKQGELIGLHPFLTKTASWKAQLSKLNKVLQLNQSTPAYYYGTGCGQASGCNIVSQRFRQFCPMISPVIVNSDLLAAAHALCQQRSGVVCILGTGSNTAYYDGHQLAARQGGFGYVLGDEGSGASIGRILLQAFLYNQLGEALEEWLKKTQKLNAEEIVSTLYQTEAPSQYLAQYATIVHQWVEKDLPLRQLVKNNFGKLADNCLIPLLQIAGTSKVHFIGSVAFHFKSLIQEALSEFNIEVGIVLQEPLLELVYYHQQTLKKSYL